jgi:DNA-binding response OmpR family regulator
MTGLASASFQPTVLLVEDDELVLDAMTRTLVRQGYLVLSARTGHGAMSLMYTPLQPINVVVLDLNLPDVSGIDLCARIRELHPNLPVVVCTGSTDPADADGLANMGVHRYFHKPVPMLDLLASVEGTLPCAE